MAIIAGFGIGAAFYEPTRSLVFWGVMVAYSAEYIFALLTANPEEVPFPGAIVPVTIALICIEFPLANYSWTIYFIMAVLLVNLGRGIWRFALRSCTD